METFIEKQDDKFVVQLLTFCNNIDTYKVALGLDGNKIDALKKSSSLVAFIIPITSAMHDFSQGFTAYKNLMRYGNGNQVLGAIPVPPVFPPSPGVTQANIQGQFADLIQDCVRSKNFTTDMANALGILKPSSPFNPQDGKPVIKVKSAEGGHPLLHTQKGNYQGWELWKDRGDGKSFVKIKEVLHPDYLDLDPLPALGASAVWKYKAIYIYKDKQAGSWSDEATITVYGHV